MKPSDFVRAHRRAIDRMIRRRDRKRLDDVGRLAWLLGSDSVFKWAVKRGLVI